MNNEDFDQPGMLSIVVQGGLFLGNLIETANYLSLWRELFPNAEIILSISSGDVLPYGTKNGVLPKGYLQRAQLDERAKAPHIFTALKTIDTYCDIVCLADEALPLPATNMSENRPCNINFVIASTNAGLSLASGKYVMRIRSDMVFADRSFINQYLRLYNLPRGQATCFEQRVLICPLYTHNPYVFEQMPLFYSDWFHFGLLSDVRKLFDVPFYPMSDALYYRHHTHADHSNPTSRLLGHRVAVEQHIYYSCFKNFFPDLKLDYYNDLRSVDLALRILADNFIVSDIDEVACIFNKYIHELARATRDDPVFVTFRDWRRLVDNPNVDTKDLFEEKIMRHADGVYRSFPISFDAMRLETKDSRRILNNGIYADRTGVICYGPYIKIPRGSYIATFHFHCLVGRGSVEIRATSEAGKIQISSKVLVVERAFEFAPTQLELGFSIEQDVAENVEFLCLIDGLSQAYLAKIEVARNPSELYEGPRNTEEIVDVPPKRVRKILGLSFASASD